MRRWQLWAMSAVLLCALVGLVLAQAGGAGAPAGGGAGAAGGGRAPGGGGGRGGGGGMGGRGMGPMTPEMRQQFVQRRVDGLKQELSATDQEWQVLQEPITALINLQMDDRQAGQPLREAVAKEGVTNDELKAALDTYRKAIKANTEKRTKLQEQLRGLITVKQEATLVVNSILD